jgi:uncharacterized repeat protein (TIGR01451 family)
MFPRSRSGAARWRGRSGKWRAAAAAATILLSSTQGAPVFAGAPTLQTITIDGNMADWAAVLADPDNVYLDGPAGGLPDVDAPADPVLNLDTFAYTWDATNLYLYVHRQGTTTNIKYYWFFFDADNDGRMEQAEPVLRLEWWGSNRRTALRRDSYDAVDKVNGDLASSGGFHDGYTLPGKNVNGFSTGNPNGGSANGLAAEASISWANLGIPAGSAMTVHVSSTRTLAAIPTDVIDNMGGDNWFTSVLIDPDRSAATTPGTNAVFAHTVTNTGNLADRFDLTWTSSGAFTPTSVAFYGDADASGTLTPGDALLTDTDADGTPDTGLLSGLNGVLRILAVVATPPGGAVGSTATILLRARSSYDPTLTDIATDTLTLGGPTLTLLKSASVASAAPGDTIVYTVTYTNSGNLQAQNVVVTDSIPAPSVYVAGSASGAGTVVTYSHDGGSTWDASQALPVTHLRWTLSAPLAASASGTVTFSVQVP